eukprot:TRINITY_DN29967_c0_g1_i1.p1 TRINITY_DN29967_c0_g1~~TRINITY_DN29967_c0_g1_i1.p1  ORF type:complete len:691 (-),score=79.97 TRINITY_DN29967_c0_g1_i1:16-2088(-)
MVVLLTVSREDRDVVGRYFVAGTPQVGPGSYEVRGPATGPASGGVVSKGLRPKLRSTGFPGPGAYEVRRAASEPCIDRPLKTNPAMSKSAFRSTLQRSKWLQSIGKDNPSPDTYSPSPGAAIQTKRPWTEAYFTRSQGGRLDDQTNAAVKSAQASQRPLTQSSASIPVSRDPSTFNYTGREGDRPEPGDYSLAALEIGHDAREVVFSTGAERRLYPPAVDRWSDRGMEANPGPGTYEHLPMKAPSHHPGKLPAGSGGGGPPVAHPPFGSDTPQLTPSQPYISKSNSPALAPGPSTYFAPEEGDSQDGPKPLEYSEYRSKTSRDGWWRPALTQPFSDPDWITSLAGPGHYPSHSVFEKKKASRARTLQDLSRKKFVGVTRPHNLKSLYDSDGAILTGFGSSQPRLPAPRSKQAPDQCTYDPLKPMGQPISDKESAKLQAFLRSKDGDRAKGSFLDVTNAVPAGSLLHADITHSADAAGGSYRSGQARLPKDPTVDHSPKPAPGAYDPILDQNYRNLDKKCKTEHLCFGRTSERFGSFETDGPEMTAYDARAAQGNTGGFMCSREDRKLDPRHLKKNPSTGLDPGNYNVSCDLLRKTFNITADAIAERLQSPSEKRPPPKGAFPWAEGDGWQPRQVRERMALEEARRATSEVNEEHSSQRQGEETQSSADQAASEDASAIKSEPQAEAPVSD